MFGREIREPTKKKTQNYLMKSFRYNEEYIAKREYMLLFIHADLKRII